MSSSFERGIYYICICICIYIYIYLYIRGKGRERCIYVYIIISDKPVYFIRIVKYMRTHHTYIHKYIYIHISIYIYIYIHIYIHMHESIGKLINWWIWGYPSFWDLYLFCPRRLGAETCQDEVLSTNPFEGAVCLVMAQHSAESCPLTASDYKMQKWVQYVG